METDVATQWELHLPLGGNCFCNLVEPAFATEWKLALQHSRNCRCNLLNCHCNLVEPALATEWKLALQHSRNCRCNLVETAFATWWKLVLQIATRWKLPLQRSLETGLKPESHGAVAPMAAANRSYMSDYVICSTLYVPTLIRTFFARKHLYFFKNVGDFLETLF
jgi:hypothetical protein